MIGSRITLLRLLGALSVSLPVLATGIDPIVAQEYPTRNITMVVPFPAGGPIDQTARLIAQPMSERLGKPLVIENVAGAGTSIGSLRVARAAPDGHTLLLQNLALAATGTLYPQSGLDPAENFTTISFLASNALVVVGRKGLAPSSLGELQAWMKTNRAKFAHPGVGTTGHLTSVVLAKRFGVEIDLVPYRGAGPAMTDLVAGHVDLFIGAPLSVVEHVRSGTLKAYGVTTAASIPQLPAVPSLAKEVSSDLEVLFWTGLFAPAGTPKPIVDRISAVLELVINSEAVVKSFSQNDMQLYALDKRSPAGSHEMFRAEVRRWSTLIRENNIRAAD